METYEASEKENKFINEITRFMFDFSHNIKIKAIKEGVNENAAITTAIHSAAILVALNSWFMCDEDKKNIKDVLINKCDELCKQLIEEN